MFLITVYLFILLFNDFFTLNVSTHVSCDMPMPFFEQMFFYIQNICKALNLHGCFVCDSSGYLPGCSIYHKVGICTAFCFHEHSPYGFACASIVKIALDIVGICMVLIPYEHCLHALACAAFD